MEWAFKEVFALPGEVRSYFWANWPATLPFEVSLAGGFWQLEGSHGVGHGGERCDYPSSKARATVTFVQTPFTHQQKNGGCSVQDKKRTTPPAHLKQSKPSNDLPPRQYSYFSRGGLLQFGSPLRKLFPNTDLTSLGLEVTLDFPAGSRPLG